MLALCFISFRKITQSSPSASLLFVFHAARKRNKNARIDNLRAARLFPREKAASATQLFSKQGTQLVFQSTTSMLWLKNYVVQGGFICYKHYCVSPYFSHSTRGSWLPDSGKCGVFSPPGLQTVVMNRNTVVIGTKALSMWSSGVSMEYFFLEIILTDITLKLSISGVLNMASVKGVYRKTSWIFRNLNWRFWLWGVPLKWITLLKWMCTWF